MLAGSWSLLVHRDPVVLHCKDFLMSSMQSVCSHNWIFMILQFIFLFADYMSLVFFAILFNVQFKCIIPVIRKNTSTVLKTSKDMLICMNEWEIFKDIYQREVVSVFPKTVYDLTAISIINQTSWNIVCIFLKIILTQCLLWSMFTVTIFSETTFCSRKEWTYSHI